MSPILFVLVLALAGIVSVLVSLVVRTWRSARERRRRDAVERLRPAAMELVDTDDALAPSLTGMDADVFADLLVHYSRLLRGEAEGRIAGYFEASGTVDRYRRRLRSRRERLRVDAAYRLGDLASVTAVPDLVAALDDRSPDVRAAAVRSLGQLAATDAVEELIEAGVTGKVPQAVVCAALIETGPVAVPHLVDLLDDDNPHARACVLDLIGQLGSAADADKLPRLLRDMSAEVRAAAAGALGRLGAGPGRDALIVHLQDRVPFVRSAAAQALGQIGGQAAATALLEVARHDEFDPAAQAAQALARIDPALVLAAVEEPDAGPYLREAADRLML